MAKQIKKLEYDEKILKEVEKVIATQKPKEGNPLLIGPSYRGYGLGGKVPDRFSGKKYRNIVNPVYQSPAEMEAIGQAAQSGLEVAGNAALGLLGNTFAGILDAFGSNDMIDASQVMLGDQEAKFGNVFNSWANKVREKTQIAAPIYNTSSSISSGEYWANQISQLGTTAGIIVEALGEQALLTAITGSTLGAGVSLQAAALARTLSKLGKVGKALNAIGRFINNPITKQAAFGAYQGVKEGYMNAMEAMNSSYNEYKSQGMSEEKARKLAAEVATKSYRAEIGPIMALNMLQWGALSKYDPFKKSKVASGVSDYVGNLTTRLAEKMGVKSKFGKWAADWGGQALSESIEEGYQTSAQSFAKYLTDEKYGLIKGDKTLSDYIFTNELRDSMIGGAIGGVGFRAILGGYENKQQAKRDKMVQKNMQGLMAKQSENIASLKKLMKERDIAKEKNNPVVENLLSKMIAHKRRLSSVDIISAAVKNDYDKGDGEFTTFNSVVGQMQEQLNYVNNGEIEKLKALKLEDEDIVHISETFPGLIEDANFIKDNLVSNLNKQVKVLGKEDYWAAEKMTMNQFERRVNTAAIEEREKTINDILDSFDDLTEEQKKYLKASSKLDAYNSQKRTLSKEMKEEKKELENFVRDFSETEGNVIPRTVDGVFRNQKDIVDYTEANYIAAEKYSNMLNKEYISKVANERLQKTVDEYMNAKTLEEVDNAREVLKDKRVINLLGDKINEYSKELDTLEKNIKIKNETKVKEGELKLKKAAERAEKSENEERIESEVAKRILEEERKNREKNLKDDSIQKLAEALNEKPGKPKPFTERQKKEAEKRALKYTPESENKIPTNSVNQSRSGIDASPNESSDVSDETRALFKKIASDFIKDNPGTTMEDYFITILRSDIIPNEYVKDNFGDIARGYFDAQGRGYVYKEVEELYNKLIEPRFDEKMLMALERIRKETASKTAKATEKSDTKIKDETPSIQEISESEEIVITDREIIEQLIKNTDVVYDFNENGDPILYVGKKTAAPSLKIPFAGENYSEEKVGNKVSFVNDKDANRDDDINRRSFLLDPNMAKVGTPIRVYIPTGTDLMNEKVVEWFEENGVKKRNLISFSEWMQKNPNAVEGSAEWVSKVPVIMEVQIQGQWVNLGNALHEPDWWNERNVADFGLSQFYDSKTGKLLENVESNKLGITHEQALTNQQRVIEQGKRVTNAAREILWNKVKDKRASTSSPVFVDMEITARVPNMSVEYPGNEIHTLSEANNELIISTIEPGEDKELGIVESKEDGKTLNYDPNKIWNSKKIGHINNLSNKGKTVTLIPYTEENGEVVYLMQLVITNAKQSQEMFIKASKTRDTIYRLYESKDKSEENKAKLQTVLELANVEKNIRNFILNNPVGDAGNELLLNNLLDMYPKTNNEDKNIAASVTTSFLKGDKKKVNFLLLEDDGNFKVYNSDNAREGDSSYTQFLKDTLYTHNRYITINDHNNPGKTKKVADPQPRIEINFSAKSIAEEKKSESNVVSKKDQEEIDKQGKSEEVDPITRLFGEQKTAASYKEVEAQQTNGIEDSQWNLFVKTGIVSNEIINTIADKLKNSEQLTDREISIYDKHKQRVEDKLKADISKIEIDAQGKIVSIGEGERELIVSNLYNSILKELSELDVITNGDIHNALVNSIDKYLSKIQEDYPAEWEYIKSNAAELLGLGTFKEEPGTVRESLLNFFRQQDNAFEDFEIDIEESGQEKDFTKLSQEYDVRVSMSDRVKMAFSGVVVDDKRRTLPQFGGLREYMELDDAFSAIQDALANSPNTVESFNKNLDAKIQKNEIEFGFLKDIKTIFSNLSPHLQKEILFLLNQSRVDMYMVFASSSEYEGLTSYKMQILDANSRNPIVGTKIAYKENLKTSPLIIFVDKNKYKLSALSEDIIKKLDGFIISTERPDFISLSNTLSYFGISVYPDVLQSIYEGEPSAYNRIKNGLFTQLRRNLKDFSEVPGKIFDITEDSGNILLNDTNNQLKIDFISKVIEHTFNVDQSMYIAGKTINSFSQPNFSTEQLRKIKSATEEDFKNIESDSVVSKLLRNDYSKHSLLLNLIRAFDSRGNFKQSSKDLLRSLNLGYVSLEAFKRKGHKTPDRNSIADLSPADYDNVQIGAFMDMGAEVKTDSIDYLGVSFRKAKMFFPTLSDSSQMFFFDTAVMNLKDENFSFNAETELIEDFNNNDAVTEILYSQMVLPELERIIQSKISGKNPFGKSGEMFLTTPSLNMVKGKDDKNNITVLQAIKSSVITDKEAMLSFIEENYKENFKSQLFKIIKAEADKYLSIEKSEDDTIVSGTWVKNGYITKDKKGNITTQILDSKFLKSKSKNGSSIKRMQIAAYDFAINNFISLAQVQMLFVSDIANYQKFNADDLFNNGDITNPKGETEEENLQMYLNASTGTANNLAKRLKGLLSPGNRIADSENQKYYQLMIEDTKETSYNFHQYAELWYGKLSEENREKIENFYELSRKLRDAQAKLPAVNERAEAGLEIKTLKDAVDNKRKELSKLFPAVSAYLKNAATDAQEYTTWREHLHILRNTGKVTEEQYQTIKSKLEQQSNGVTDSNRLTKEERVAFQPMKPLHSGMYIESEADGAVFQKYVYIKSSSFPLLPEMTVNSPLDNLRKNMERLETGGKFVRASYQTANKVGATNKPANINTLTYNDELTFEDLEESILILDRDNFSIQQEKPDKTSKHLKEMKRDDVGVGTQIEKILLSGGINRDTKKVFNSNFEDKFLKSLGITKENGKISGEDLNKIYTHLYTDLEETKKNMLLDSLNINRRSFEIGSVESMERMRDALSQRLTNKQDKEILELRYIVQYDDGRKVSYSKKEIEEQKLKPDSAEFIFPIWLSPNSRKFESVLNAIVSNDLVKLKLPGNSFVVGSSEGLRTKSVSLSSISEETKQGIIWSPRFDQNQTELYAERIDTETGEVLPAQIVIASKFRKKVEDKVTGEIYEELIDMREYTKDGLLDLSRIDPEVLQLMSFRIPTSAHQSGSLLEIVGFLPPESTDLMLVPKEHTTKIGEDYDIDARYTYSGNYVTDKDGNIRYMRDKDIDAPLKSEINKLYRDFKEYEKDIEEYLSEVEELDLDEIEIARNIFDTTFRINTLKEEEEDIDSEELANLYSKLNEYQVQAEMLGKAEELGNIKSSLYTNFVSEKAEAAKAFLISQRRQSRRIKVMENNIINVYKSVYSSNDPAVRKLINATINTDLSDATVKEIDKVVSNLDANTFSIFSGSYQKSIMALGASGKMGIGVHSNWVVFNSLLQQLEKPLQLLDIDFDEKGVPYIVNFSMRFGNFESNGQLGLINSLRPIANQELYKDIEFPSIADSNMENQNSATDNQNKGNMGRRNENKYTINVFAILCNMGLSKDIVNGKEMHYPSLFLAQPILKRYVELMEENDSSFSPYSKDVEAEIIKKLKEEFASMIPFYKEGNNLSRIDMFEISEQMTGQKLFENLKFNPQSLESQKIQWAVFEKFLHIKGLSEDISKLQKATNIRNLGKSYFDVLSMKEIILNGMDSAADNDTGLMIDGMQEMFGDSPEDLEPIYSIRTPEQEERIENLLNEGFIYIGINRSGHMIFRRPNSPNSAKILNTVSTGYHLWGNIFPYENPFVSQQIDDVLESTHRLDSFSSSAMDIRFDVKNQMQDFIYSFSKLSIFDGTPDINSERERLFMDMFVEDESGNQRMVHTSLATYLNSLKMLKTKLPENGKFKPEEIAAIELFQRHFFKNLEFEIAKNEPSIIKYSINNSNSFNKNRPHNDLLRMMNSQQKLPDFNGDTNYTFEKLVKDLTKYALLSKTENGAIGFRNYIPMAVFKKYNLNSEMLDISDLNLNGGRIFNVLFNGSTRSITSLLRSSIETNILTQEKVINIPSEYVINKDPNYSNIDYTIRKANENLGVNMFERKGNVIHVKENPTAISKNRFLRQYYQHNPENAYKLNFKDIGVLLKKQVVNVKGFTRDFKELSGVFSDMLPGYISVEGTEGVYLYELVDVMPTEEGYRGKYEKINTLGGLGVNEYNPSAEVNASLYPQNNLTGKETDIKVREKNKEEKLSFGKGVNISQAIQRVINVTSTNPEVVKVQELLKYLIEENGKSNFLDKTITVYEADLGDSVNGVFATRNGNYNNVALKAGNIYMNTNKKGSEDFITSFTEEVIHALTTKELSKYIKRDVELLLVSGNSVRINGDAILEDAPAHIVKLAMLFSDTAQSILTEAAAEQKITISEAYYLSKKYSEWLTSPNRDENDRPNVGQILSLYGYRLSNIDEFVAGSLSNIDFKRKLANITYKNSNKSIIEHFAEIIEKIVNTITGKNMLDEVSTTVKEMITNTNSKTNTSVKTPRPVSVETQKKNDAEAEELLNKNSEKKITHNTYTVEQNNPKDFINHSGGAYGGDTFWDIIGREFGVTNHRHYRDANNANLSQQLKNKGVKAEILTKEQMNFARQKVKELLGIEYSDDLKGNLQVRNFYQVYNADAVYAIAKINSNKTGVSGGTNTAVQLGIKLNKPVYVWDINSEQWYKFEGVNNPFSVAIIPQNLTSGETAFGTTQVANEEAKELLGPKPTSIDMVEAGIRTRTTRSVGEMEKYNIKVGDIVTQRGKSADGSIKEIKTRITAIHPKGTPEFLGNWDKEGWTQEGIDAIKRYKDGAAAIEFEVITNNLDNNSGFIPTETPTLTKNFAGVGSRDIENYNVQKNGKWQPREEYVGKEKEEKAKQAIRDVYEKTIKSLIPPQQKPEVAELFEKDTYRYYGKTYTIITNQNGVGIDVENYKGRNIDKQKLLSKYNENPNVDPQSGKSFREVIEEENVIKDSKYELFPGVYANEGQRNAIDKLTDFLKSNKETFVLVGRGGTGKTTIIKKILQSAGNKSVGGITVAHKAKKVLGRSIGKNHVSTIASALAIKLDESTGNFVPDEFSREAGIIPIRKFDIIIVDEASMISQAMFDEIMTLKKSNAKVIFMGDNAQLPPIGDSKESPVFDIGDKVVLTERMRQAKGSPILDIGDIIANNIESEEPVLRAIKNESRRSISDKASKSLVIYTNNEEDSLNDYVEDFKNGNGNPDAAKVVTFNNERHNSSQSVGNLNTKIRAKLWGEKNNNQFNEGELLTAYDTFTKDDRPVFTNSEDFIVVSSNKRIETGVVSAYSKNKGSRIFTYKYEIEYLTLKNEDGEILYDIPVIAESSKRAYEADMNKLWRSDSQLAYSLKNEFANLQYGYAITSHKAQGSTYTNVYVMEDNILGATNASNTKAKNQSLYVAVSRPTTKLVMISNKNSSNNSEGRVNIDDLFSPVKEEPFLPKNIIERVTQQAIEDAKKMDGISIHKNTDLRYHRKPFIKKKDISPATKSLKILSDKIIKDYNLNTSMSLFTYTLSQYFDNDTAKIRKAKELGEFEFYEIGINENFLDILREKVTPKPYRASLDTVSRDFDRIQKQGNFVEEDGEIKPDYRREVMNISGKRSQQDQAIQKKYFPKDKVSSSKILDKIAKSNHPLNILAKTLQKYIKINDVQVELVDTDVFEINDVRASAYFSPDENIIRVAKNAYFRGLGSEPTLLHEVIHALTYNTLKINTPQSFTDLYKYIKENIEDKNHYGLKNMDEFMVAIFTDGNLIDKMLKIPAMEGLKYKNILEELFDYILSLFKINKSNSVYEQAFSVATNILEDALNQKEMADEYASFKEAQDTLMNIKPGVSELFESNPELANAVYEALGLNTINGSEITYTDEEGNPCAKMGLTNTVKGSGWKIVKDFKGQPKHSNGGVDITISDKGVTMRRGGKDIKAKYGLLISNNNNN